MTVHVMGQWTILYRTEAGDLVLVGGCNRSKTAEKEADRAETVAHWTAHVLLNQRLGNRLDFPKDAHVLAVTPGEMNNLVFRGDFAACDPLRQQLYRVLWPELAVKLDDPAATFDKMKSVERLGGSAAVRLHALGLSETCPRCLGSGTYSSCERFGTTCFTCAIVPGQPGRGYVMPKITRNLIAAAQERLAQQPAKETVEHGR